MRRILALSFFLLICSSVLHAQAHASVDTATYNFGKVKAGQTPKHSFIIRNTGNSPLIINDIEASCGCLVISYTKAPIPPGKSGKIDVVLSTESKIGFQLRSATVITNADNPQLVLYMKGEVVNSNRKK
jgi:hypothetical protein